MREPIRLPWRGVSLALGLAAAMSAATFGTVVPIGGQASDVALDEARGVLYIANFTANRVEVLSLTDLKVHTSMNVAAQPGALALSPDGQFLVVAHFGNFQAPSPPANALSVINVASPGTRQTFGLGSTPLGVAFGNDGLALVVTTDTFVLLDPASGATQVIDTIAGVTAKTLPVPPVNFPPQIIAAAVAASRDGLQIFGLTDTIRFRYDVRARRAYSLGYTASPPMGPRVVSASRDGSYYAAGWGLFDRSGVLISQFANPSGALNVGSHAIDSDRGLIYAQIPQGVPQSSGAPSSSSSAAPAAPPVLQILDADNLAVREQLQLPENLAGHAVLNAAGTALYAVSDSGAMILPVGSLGKAHRLVADHEDLVFRGNLCDNRVATQDLVLTDPGGGTTDFTLSTSTAGISISPAVGKTPATIHVSVDPNVFQGQMGTAAAQIQVSSAAAVNLPPAIRVLINNRAPDQRGTFVNVPGQLVDVVADPSRNRFYVLRQDKNVVLVFDTANNTQIATLRTANTPTQMAVSFDGKYLLVGHDNAQIATVYDLDTLQPDVPIVFPAGHYPRSLAVSGKAILASCRVAGPIHMIDRVDLGARMATALPSLGVYQNTVNVNTVLTAAPNGSAILGAEADGTVLLYDASADTFTASRKDFTELSGAFAASSYGQFLVDNNLLNASLVPIRKLDASSGSSSGFAFVDQSGFRSTALTQAGPGMVQRVDLPSGQGLRPVRTTEAPLLGSKAFPFTRTLAPLFDQSAVISLTTSGFTVLPWEYDAAVAPPQIQPGGERRGLHAAGGAGRPGHNLRESTQPCESRHPGVASADGARRIVLDGERRARAHAVRFVHPGQRAVAVQGGWQRHAAAPHARRRER
jgi:DNA-binding beta-propeller fold protein YncE